VVPRDRFGDAAIAAVRAPGAVPDDRDAGAVRMGVGARAAAFVREQLSAGVSGAPR
jgi:hypothetical protein